MMKETQKGIIVKGIGGFYYVEVADTVYTCKARGNFRKQGITPVAGDHVEITVQDAENGTVEAVLPRRNFLLRPPVANVDMLVIVVSVADPAPNLQVIDKMIAIAEQKEIEPVLVVNKTDLKDGGDIVALYEKAGFTCFSVSAKQPETVRPLYDLLQGKVSAFTGNSGVGKSSILNAIDPRFALETGEISKKLGRGRHTTRCATLFTVGTARIADTPGFSSLDVGMVEETLDKERLFYSFREFEPYFGKCRFSTCTHTKEPACAVRAAVEAGEVAPSRYENYVSLYEQLKGKKEWENK